MNRKIIFFDIDGTIMSSKTHHISESTRHAIRKARANGNLAFVNTGRTMAEIENEITDVGFDGYVCGCGTYITYCGSILHHSALSQKTTQMLIEDLHRYNLEAILEGTSAVYYDTRIRDPFLQKKYDRQKNVYGFPVSTWDDPEILIDKFTAKPSENGTIDGFMEKYRHCFDFINHGGNVYEVIQKGYSKATGIMFLQEYLHIPFEHTYAMGDSSNDLTMLRYVNHSIAMGNSNETILKMASFVTEDVDNGGVAYALENYKII